MPFQKGNQLARGNGGGLRTVFTSELIQQLDEMVQYKFKNELTKEQLTFKERICRNLIMRAACLGDEFDKDGKLTKMGLGDLQAIVALMDRLEGKPKQQVTGPDDGPVQVQYRTIEEVHMYLLSRGIDALRVPPPPLRLVSKE
jgi:hypothetical protein